MSKRVPVPQSLVDDLESTPAARRPTWLDRLTQEQRAELESVREAVQAGRLKHLHVTEILAKCQERLGVSLNYKSFRDWLAGK